MGMVLTPPVQALLYMWGIPTRLLMEHMIKVVGIVQQVSQLGF